ncbi:MAG: phosphotransferase [Spirochaetota bacterium]
MSISEENHPEHAEILTGGNMNAPERIGSTVRRKTTPASPTIHRLLTHLRGKGIDWVPTFHGIADDGREILSYLDGEVPHELPPWLWEEDLLVGVARAMRTFHDAAADFDQSGAVWGLDPSEPAEVICHNDFAPYNCVFRDGAFAGLLDFDLCSPGSRIWDMAYCCYRFVPIMPVAREDPTDETAPFPLSEVLRRSDTFLDAYAGENGTLRYTCSQLFSVASRRLEKLASWTGDFAVRTGSSELEKNARMYARHSRWLLWLSRL